MKLTAYRNDAELKTTYVLEIDDSEKSSAVTTPFDKMVMDDCFESENATVADKLLGLECMARTIERGQGIENPKARLRIKL